MIAIHRASRSVLLRRALSGFEPLESRQMLSDTPPTTPPLTTSIVHGNVFRDINRDGVKQTTEPWQAGVKVYLDYNDNGTRDGDAEPIAITDANGRYTFAAATAPATISIRLLLTGTNLVQTLPTDNAARQVTTVAGGNGEAKVFGVMEPIVTPPVVTVLTGIVYTDKNSNGVKDDGEVGRPNVIVYLDNNNDGLHEDGEPLTTTNVEGRYTFDGASLVSPTATTSVVKTIRLLLTDTHLKQTQPTNGAPVHATVTPGQTVQADAFGVVEITVTPPPPTTAIVNGNVFTDLNGNAVRDINERGRPNVRVYLDLNNDAKREADEPTVLTSATGSYSFPTAPVRSDLHIRLDLSGTALKQTLPTDNAARVLATVAGQTYVDQNFGVREIPTPVTPPTVTVGIIRGRVFYDANQNGKQDNGEVGVAGRSVYLDVNHSGFRDDGDPQTLTNELGNYIFESVKPGTYDVRLYRGEYTQTSPPNNGSNVAVVTAGKTVGDLFFGIYRTPGTPSALVAAGSSLSKVDGGIAAEVLA